MAYTLTYSESAQGWPSFYSFIPDMMLGMNSYFYSFKGGKLWRHNTGADRNNFYGVQYSSSITGVVNLEPSVIKKFKTVVLESNSPWNCAVESDLESGYIDSEWFSLKEGDYYAYIRRTDDDDVLESRSTQGIGSALSVNSSTVTAITVTFSFSLDSIISIGDKAYSVVSGTKVLLGVITSVNGDTITIDGTTGQALPTVGQFIMYIKNNIAESYGTTGYYLRYTITNSLSSFVEIYGVGTNLFKSFP